MKKIMISYASYGGGHLSAAKNLKEYIEKNYPDTEVFLFDCMKYINRVIDKVCGSTYSKITTNIPWFWGKIYYNTQEPIFERIMSLSNKVLSYKLGRLLRDLKPDLTLVFDVDIETWSDPGDYPSSVGRGPLPSFDYITSNGINQSD